MFYYNSGCEIDFCVPESRLAIQVSCDLTGPDTYEREVGGLEKFLTANPDYRGIIISRETETRITGKSTEITVLPVWKWLLM